MYKNICLSSIFFAYLVCEDLILEIGFTLCLLLLTFNDYVNLSLCIHIYMYTFIYSKRLRPIPPGLGNRIWNLRRCLLEPC